MLLDGSRSSPSLVALRAAASADKLLLSYIMQVARSRAEHDTVLRRASTPTTSTMRCALCACGEDIQWGGGDTTTSIVAIQQLPWCC